MTSLRRYRPTVSLPDGRVFHGQWPQSLPMNGEREHLITLAKHVNGIAEAVLSAGRADVMTKEIVFEVEPVGRWRSGARQAFSYSGMTGLRPALALFGPADYQPIHLEIQDKMAPLELWVFYGAWHHVTSRKTAGQVSTIRQLHPVPSPQPRPRLTVDPALADSTEVAEFLGVPLGTLDQWASRGGGPRFSKVGKHRRYRWADVEKWLDERAKASA